MAAVAASLLPVDSEEPGAEEGQPSVLVRNTFIEVQLQLPSQERFANERGARSCPPGVRWRSAAPPPAETRTSASPGGGGPAPPVPRRIVSTPDCLFQAGRDCGGEGPASSSSSSQDGRAAAGGDLPTKGSALHAQGGCRPCAFAARGACKSGFECRFCHLCEEGEKRRRCKQWRENKRKSLQDMQSPSKAAVHQEGFLASTMTHCDRSTEASYEHDVPRWADVVESSAEE